MELKEKTSSYHNWKLAAWVESLKSTPNETVTDASASKLSEETDRQIYIQIFASIAFIGFTNLSYSEVIMILDQS